MERDDGSTRFVACSRRLSPAVASALHQGRGARRALAGLGRGPRRGEPDPRDGRACSTDGALSVRHRARPIASCSRARWRRSWSPHDILSYDLTANAIDARDRTSYLERFIHSEIYRARPDVRAVVHCHTPSLIPFADSDVPLRAMYHMAAFVADGVPVFDIRKAAGSPICSSATPGSGVRWRRVSPTNTLR